MLEGPPSWTASTLSQREPAPLVDKGGRPAGRPGDPSPPPTPPPAAASAATLEDLRALLRRHADALSSLQSPPARSSTASEGAASVDVEPAPAPAGLLDAECKRRGTAAAQGCGGPAAAGDPAAAPFAAGLSAAAALLLQAPSGNGRATRPTAGRPRGEPGIGPAEPASASAAAAAAARLRAGRLAEWHGREALAEALAVWAAAAAELKGERRLAAAAAEHGRLRGLLLQQFALVSRIRVGWAALQGLRARRARLAAAWAALGGAVRMARRARAAAGRRRWRLLRAAMAALRGCGGGCGAGAAGLTGRIDAALGDAGVAVELLFSARAAAAVGPPAINTAGFTEYHRGLAGDVASVLGLPAASVEPLLHDPAGRSATLLLLPSPSCGGGGGGAAAWAARLSRAVGEGGLGGGGAVWRARVLGTVPCGVARAARRGVGHAEACRVCGEV